MSNAFYKIGLNSKRFLYGSLRARGATTASNLGVSDCLFYKQRRWKSERVEYRYAHEYITVPLQVTKNLQI